MASLKPRRITGRPFDKIWGSSHLEPWFPNADKKIGEVWFAEKDSPILVKFLFTTENLSVQVHPNDEQARAAGGVRGKTEMWHILRAEPGAQIALGLKEPATIPELREACLDGSIIQMLQWIPAVPGDTWFVPAGAIHAIGAGIALCEIQQNSDITYRLYDYGRDRELHLDQGLAVINPAFRPTTPPPDNPYFHVRRAGNLVAGPSSGLLIVTAGDGRVSGEPTQQGDVWNLPSTPINITGEAQFLHVTF